MTERPDPRQWKRHRWVVITTAVLWVLSELSQLPSIRPHISWHLPESWGTAIGVTFALAFWVAAGWWLWGAVRRGGRGPGHGPEDLGHPYDFELELSYNGARAPLRVVLADRAVSFELRGLENRLGVLDPPLPEGVGVDAVRALRVQPSRLLLDVEASDGPQTVTLIPRSYADRMRFLWEMAVLRPDLFDAPAAEVARTA